jgi:hypothetical protein
MVCKSQKMESEKKEKRKAKRSSPMSISQTTRMRSWNERVSSSFQQASTNHKYTTFRMETKELKDGWRKMHLTDQLQLWGIPQQR